MSGRSDPPVAHVSAIGSSGGSPRCGGPAIQAAAPTTTCDPAIMIVTASTWIARQWIGGGRSHGKCQLRDGRGLGLGPTYPASSAFRCALDGQPRSRCDLPSDLDWPSFSQP